VIKSIGPGESDVPTAAPGRPREIEPLGNLWVIHPAARAVVDVLARTRVTPNQVSMVSVVAAALAALAYWRSPWPWNAALGFSGQVVWHILDGADGDLARRTHRASPLGELIDGVCDHVSQALIYIAFALILLPDLGASAWIWAAAAALSHFLQANAYETGRKTYRQWVYGAGWMRQTGSGAGGVGAALGGLYLWVSALMAPGEDRLEQAAKLRSAESEDGAQAVRQGYREIFTPLVKWSGLLGSNPRTAAAALSILAGFPLWFFLFEISVLNAILVLVTIGRARANRRLAERLEPAPL
jgi:phosphatidylglycerophosphate synthase